VQGGKRRRGQTGLWTLLARLCIALAAASAWLVLGRETLRSAPLALDVAPARMAGPAPAEAAPAANIAPPAPAPKTDMEQFTSAHAFLPADRVIAALKAGAVLCKAYRASDNSCESTTRVRRLRRGLYEEVEKSRLTAFGQAIEFASTSRFSLVDGFACYDEPGALSLTSGTLPNQDSVLAAMREQMRAQFARYGRVCIGFAGAPMHLSLSGFDARAKRIADGARWAAPHAIVSTEPSLRAREAQ
jgi:hypothetical protein